jgi:hypothetical protein
LTLVVEPAVRFIGKVVGVLARQPLERSAVPPLRAASVAENVRCHPEQPRQDELPLEAHVRTAPPGLEEDDRGQVFCERPVRRAAEEIVVDAVSVPFEENTEGVGLTVHCTSPQVTIGRLPHRPIMSASRKEFRRI